MLAHWTRFRLGVSPFRAHSNKSYISFLGEYSVKDKTQYNGKDTRTVTNCIILTIQTKDQQFNTTLCRVSTAPLDI